MGSAEGADWVDVANDLLRTCHINQHINNLSECSADVFVRLYESILGEKVPDFIATPRSQEDDAHNVQAVIDSLALDYLQVSLSHITGENIVKGDRESIKNLLEIFDGLLEYLKEVSEASSQTGAEINVLSSDKIQNASQEQLENTAGQLTEHTLMPSVERSQSEYFILTCDTDGSESTSELIKLGDTAYSFSKRGEEFQMPELCLAEKDKGVEEPENSEALAALPQQFSESERGIGKEREDGMMESVHAAEPHKGSQSASATKLGEPIQQAIPLLPPFQPSDPGWRDYHSSDRQAAALACSQAVNIPPIEKSLTPKSDDISDGLPLSRQIPVGKMLGDDAEDNVTKVCESAVSASSSEEKLSLLLGEQVTQIPRPESQHWPRTTSKYENSTTDSVEDSLSHRTAEKTPQQEFREASENLSRRLNELDLMLKRALGEHTREEELRDEDSLSQHSDSVMDYGRRTAGRDTSCPSYPGRPRSLSPASPSSQQQHHELRGTETGQTKTIRSHLQEERDERTRKAKLVTKAYENELRIFEAREKHRISKLREAAKEVEQEYKENIFQEHPKVSRPVKVYSRKTTPQYSKYSQWIPKRGIMKPKQAAPMTIRDNDLLLQLLEEFPHLHISPRTLNKMWQQQLAHTLHLKAPSARPRPKLQNEIEQALKKQELLAAIIKRDQDHSKRLQDIKQRISRQRWAQNKVTEKKQQVARARKYYEDYRAQLRAKLLRARTREEKIFKNLFEEGLEIQKQRLRDLRVYAQEKRDEQRREHQMELESLENYYKDQFSMLAEVIAQEFQEIQTREKAQAQMLQKTKRELRSKMEKEIQQLQAAIMHSDDDTFFQELEADRLRSRLQMASFQYSQSHFF
ncbi:PREDICTED: centrosomal protein of 95 kDa [Sturnus vulgaris]|uniref:centrosomal protein of 95 kDa n=1 Tax=Sturnus vulgaris TaxID=9172 RepID=UPI00071A4B2C|nr:PREDICTED: centrosomal protein of 95 kDa [Sturnus vulgaris]XP_014738193.1 PREDICTED: centrosomal protein of 95 kDa [Sturnus vulgaris]XP_014738194.1 PREDICTED: centrosomal protein of 95 kDa [Sturnus vulgaris]